MIGAGPYRALLVLSLDEEEMLWQILDEALEASMGDHQKAYDIAVFVWEEGRSRSSPNLCRAAEGILTALWGPEAAILERS